MRDAYIVTAVRTPGCKRKKGAFAQTRPENLLCDAVTGAIERTPGLGKKDVEDILIGCCFPEAEQGLNIGRVVAQMSGFPDETSGATINRFCSSGLESIAMQASRIMSGWCDVAIAGGIESMTIVPMGGNLPRPHPDLTREKPEMFMAMGLTAENVAKRYNINREMQDEFSYHSHMKAAEARKNGSFKEIVPTQAHKYVEDKDGTIIKNISYQDFDDGIRPETTIESLSKLNPVFSAGGTVTAGNSSQMTDGAAAVLLMSEDAIRKFNIKPVAKFRYYAVTGVKPDEMGVGPAYAIPKILKLAGLTVNDIDVFEINEAFASQAVYSMQRLGLYNDKGQWECGSDRRKVNIHGGAIALGHPIGCTGSKLAAQLINIMSEKGLKYGIESMCVGGGMGAAALFELVE
ncbi:MAG: thiolase family protein [Spirochaetes bacterium]|nr:thiolase family protein [Spirochaetota bacterium]